MAVHALAFLVAHNSVMNRPSVFDLERDEALVALRDNAAFIVEAVNAHAHLLAANERLVELLAMMYDKWENGDPCWQDADEANDSLGNAFKLTDDEENAVLTALAAHRAGGV
jgi:hypothetical protein